MNPSDANSPLATLRQLKEMLDAGILTPQEFEALKQKLIFGNEPVTPLPPVEPVISAPDAELVSTPPTPLVNEEAPVVQAPATTMEWPVPAASPPAESTYYAAPLDEAVEQRNPLTLVFAIGGALLVLALVLYLALGNRSTDEHITSTSQTAADSTAVAPEVGPQAQQITLPPATAPETVRVAPTVPLPAASSFRRDSVVTPAPITTTVPATTAPPAAPVATPAPAKPTPKATPTPAAAPADTAASKSSQP
jgi:hypothetical protein